MDLDWGGQSMYWNSSETVRNAYAAMRDMDAMERRDPSPANSYVSNTTEVDTPPRSSKAARVDTLELMMDLGESDAEGGAVDADDPGGLPLTPQFGRRESLEDEPSPKTSTYTPTLGLEDPPLSQASTSATTFTLSTVSSSFEPTPSPTESKVRERSRSPQSPLKPRSLNLEPKPHVDYWDLTASQRAAWRRREAEKEKNLPRRCTGWHPKLGEKKYGVFIGRSPESWRKKTA